MLKLLLKVRVRLYRKGLAPLNLSNHQGQGTKEILRRLIDNCFHLISRDAHPPRWFICLLSRDEDIVLRPRVIFRRLARRPALNIRAIPGDN
jgi:hypothetical protein